MRSEGGGGFRNGYNDRVWMHREPARDVVEFGAIGQARPQLGSYCR
jgi:hypothetical protein